MTAHETAYETIVVERPEPRIARIVMNRPEGGILRSCGHHGRLRRRMVRSPLGAQMDLTL